jgi:hypothetical protein
VHVRTRCATGAAVAVIAALAGSVPAQAQPRVCGTRAFQAIDRAITRHPLPFARMLSFTYRFAPSGSLAGFDTLAQCDATTAVIVWNAFSGLNPTEANSFENAFFADYPTDALRVFGGSPT